IDKTGVIDASGGAGTIGGSARNDGGDGVASFPDEMEMIAVLINCDGRHGTTQHWLLNNGRIIARGGAPNGDGGDIRYPGTDTDVPLGGYAVTDDFAMPGKGLIADGPVVPAHGYLTLWLDRGASAGATHVAAALNVAGGVVGLARPDGSFIDRLTYGAQEVDLSASREPDGAAAWTIEWRVSPGAA